MSFNKEHPPLEGGDLCAIFVHAGAGFHSYQNEKTHLLACNDAARIAMTFLRSGCSAVDAVEIAIKVLEDREITNAGYGSNLSMEGTVECDATIVDHYGRSGAVGAVQYIKNPISLARLILNESTKPLSLRRVPPNLLVGQGATDYAFEHGMPILPPDFLISPASRERWLKWKNDLQIATGDKPDKSSAVSQPIASDEDIIAAKPDDNSRRGSQGSLRSLSRDFPNSSNTSYSPLSAITLPSRHMEPSPLTSTARQMMQSNADTPRGSPSDEMVSLEREPLTTSGLKNVDRKLYQTTQGDMAKSTIGKGHLKNSADKNLISPTESRPVGCSQVVHTTQIGNIQTNPFYQQALPLRRFDPERTMTRMVSTMGMKKSVRDPFDDYFDNYQPGLQFKLPEGTVETPFTTHNEPDDNITDTVGAIAVDSFGNIAAGSSSGGIGMKHPGRTGPAALVGIGTSVIPIDPDDYTKTSVATVTSGTGEHMATTMAAATCAERLYSNVKRTSGGSFEAASEEEIMESMIANDFMGHPGVMNSHCHGALGVMAVKKTRDGIYLYFAHNTDSFALASMNSEDRRPVCTMSRNTKNGSIAQGARVSRARKRHSMTFYKLSVP